MVPLLDIKPQHQAIEPELRAAFDRVLRSGQFILGPEVQSFERKIAQCVQTRHAIGVSSGTDAILLALMALEIGLEDEVICPSFTFFATAGCISRVGAKPVFVDCCPVCFNLDVTDVARKITPRTKAILPVHLFGQAANLDGLMALAHKHQLQVIEDAAQAIGAQFRGRKVGGFGAFGTFSFFPTKNLGALGDAGMLVTNDDALAERARLLRTHGAKEKYFHQMIGANFRLDALQAAFLSVKLPQLDQYTARRRENAAFYTDQLSKLPGVALGDSAISRCQSCDALAKEHSRPAQDAAHSLEHGRLILPVAYAHNFHIWNQYTVRVPGAGRRDALKTFLGAHGIGAEVYYPLPLHQQQCFAPARGWPEALPISETLASQCLSIPIYPELCRDQLQEVVAAIASFLADS